MKKTILILATFSSLVHAQEMSCVVSSHFEWRQGEKVIATYSEHHAISLDKSNLSVQKPFPISLNQKDYNIVSPVDDLSIEDTKYILKGVLSTMVQAPYPSEIILYAPRSGFLGINSLGSWKKARPAARSFRSAGDLYSINPLNISDEAESSYKVEKMVFDLNLKPCVDKNGCFSLSNTEIYQSEKIKKDSNLKLYESLSYNCANQESDHINESDRNALKDVPSSNQKKSHKPGPASRQ